MTALNSCASVVPTRQLREVESIEVNRDGQVLVGGVQLFAYLIPQEAVEGSDGRAGRSGGIDDYWVPDGQGDCLSVSFSIVVLSHGRCGIGEVWL